MEYLKKGGKLVCVKDPFTQNVTYFLDLSGKIPYVNLKDFLSDFLEEERGEEEGCVFCPGRESETPSPILSLSYKDVFKSSDSREEWLIRVFRNKVPKVPPILTGGVNESYVVVEDRIHLLPDGRLNHTGAFSFHHIVELFKVFGEVTKLSFKNSFVKSVLIKKNQFKTSGGTQSHPHSHVVGVDRNFPDVEREIQTSKKDPKIWEKIFEFVRKMNFLLLEDESIISFRSPFGKFPLSFDIFCKEYFGYLGDLDERILERLCLHIKSLLFYFGARPLDFEIHQEKSIPLHIHLNLRVFPYITIGGVNNLPEDMPERCSLLRKDLEKIYEKVKNHSVTK